MTLRQQAARGVFWTAAGNWGQHLATFVVFIFLSRLLTPRAFGLVALAAVFVAFLKIVAQGGLADAIVQRPQIDREHLDTAFWATLGLGVILAAVTALLAQFVAALLDQPSVGPVLAWLALSLVLSGLSSVQRGILARELRFASLTLRQLLSVLVGGIVGVTAAFMGMGVWSLVVQTLTTELVAVIVLWGVSDWRPRWRFSWQRFKELATFAVSVVGFRIMLFVYRRADDLLIGYFLGPIALGFYAIAYRLLQIMINATTSIIDAVAFPVFSRIQAKQARMRSAYYEATQFTALITFPVFIGAAIMASEITVFLFGEKWIESAPALRFLALAGLVQSMLFLNGTVMKSLGKPSWRLVITSIAAVANVGAFALVVHWGITAVAAAFAAVAYVLAPLSYVAVNRLVSIDARTYGHQIRSPFLASLLMAAVVIGLRLATATVPLALRVPGLVLAGMLTYLASIWLVDRSLVRRALVMAREAIPTRRG